MFAAKKKAAPQIIARHRRSTTSIALDSCELTRAPGSVITRLSEQCVVIRVTDVSLIFRHI
jgi:hypothetical protein